MNETLSFSEKFFSLFCNKNIEHWDTTKKGHLSEQELMAIQQQEWKKFWSRMDVPVPDFTDKIVVDYGCGEGYDSLIALQGGAKHVYSLEISENRLKAACALHKLHGFGNVTYINNTNVPDLPSKIGSNSVDIIYCRDVMEHVPFPQQVLESMYSAVKPDGEVCIGFSPLYKSPYGPHFGAKCRYPWIHLIFSEQTIINVFKKTYGLNASVNCYLDIEGSGVNKLSYFDYKKLVGSFQWQKEVDLMNRFPDRRLLMLVLNFLVCAIPVKRIKELFIVNSYTKLVKINDLAKPHSSGPH